MFISHRLDEIFSICDSVTVMRNGRTIATVSSGEVSEDELLGLMTEKDVEDIRKEKAIMTERKVYNCEGRKKLLSLKDFVIRGFDETIDIDVYEGDIIGIAGLQGHGQSSLVRQLFALGGQIKYILNGEEITVRSAHDAVKKQGIAFISGDREGEGVFSEQTLSDNLSIASCVKGVKKQKAARDILEENGVVFASEKQKITDLSGGNQQKVVIGRWMSTNPLLLLADDPTKGIDVNARAEVHKIMYKLANEHSAIIMVSSDDYELVALAENAENAKIIVMYEGKISRVLTGNSITVDNIVAASLGTNVKEVVQ
jgi:ribose transport system ATP-binding protein